MTCVPQCECLVTAANTVYSMWFKHSLSVHLKVVWAEVAAPLRASVHCKSHFNYQAHQWDCAVRSPVKL